MYSMDCQSTCSESSYVVKLVRAKLSGPGLGHKPLQSLAEFSCLPSIKSGE